MTDLTYRLVNLDPPGYRVCFDGVEVGSISKRLHHVKQREHWHWGIDTMPLMDHGGRVPSGDADTFDKALADFKVSFIGWHGKLRPGLWEENRHYIKAIARGRK